MTRIAITLFLICAHIIYCIQASKLTPRDFDRNLKGYPFCSYGSADQLKQMCLKLANQLGLAAFDESYLNDLQCEEQRIWLKGHAQDAEWESRDTYLLECIYYWSDDGSKSKKYLGDGFNTNDVFLYSPDSQGDITADSNYRNFLKSIFG